MASLSGHSRVSLPRTSLTASSTEPRNREESSRSQDSRCSENWQVYILELRWMPPRVPVPGKQSQLLGQCTGVCFRIRGDNFETRLYVGLQVYSTPDKRIDSPTYYMPEFRKPVTCRSKEMSRTFKGQVFCDWARFKTGPGTSVASHDPAHRG